MRLAQLFILILAFLIIKPASAGLLIEPVIGYSLGKIEVGTAGSSEEKANGPSLGGRLGYQNLGFQLGLDYLRSNLNVDDSDYKEDLVTNEFAGFVGFEFPVLLRVYAGYIFGATGETEADFGSGKQKVEVSEGSGVKFGVGFTGLPFVDLNLEYRKGTFGKTEVGGTDQDADTDFSAVMLSASLPFVL